MIQRTPTLMFRRLIVYSGFKAVYDQTFRPGINIIRGANGSGKSTIADFLFFALGGEINTWKPEAEHCDRLVAEILINGTALTLQRQITTSSRQPMAIFWGDYDAAKSSTADGWQVFPFQRSKNKESFSQVLFRAMGLPEVHTDLENNITMHQLLRLLYVDQLSTVDNLMRSERFDYELTRMAVRDLLYGIYDDSLYRFELQISDLRRENEKAKADLKSAQDILGEAGQELDFIKITRAIQETQNDLLKTQAMINTLMSQSAIAVPVDIDLSKVRDKLVEFRKARELRELEISRHEFEIEDSKQFIDTLESRLISLDDSIITRNVLGALPLNLCPNCLSPIQPSIEQGLCLLCKQPTGGKSLNSQALRIKQEIQFQIKESKHLLSEKQQKLISLRQSLPMLVEKENSAQWEFDTAVNNVRTDRDQKLDSLLIQKGALEGKTESLHAQAKAIGVLERLKIRIADLAREIQKLELEIVTRKKAQHHKEIESEQEISRYVVKLLRSDLPREEMFQSASNILIDFSKNTFAVNGRNQFSASSIGYLKNCVHYSIFFASLNLDYFRYPRFILCDNMEDKGMEQLRSQNFQKLIVSLSKQSDIHHQIIFTTSMIDPSLNMPELCIGPEYNQQQKSLNV